MTIREAILKLVECHKNEVHLGNGTIIRIPDLDELTPADFSFSKSKRSVYNVDDVFEDRIPENELYYPFVMVNSDIKYINNVLVFRKIWACVYYNNSTKKDWLWEYQYGDFDWNHCYQIKCSEKKINEFINENGGIDITKTFGIPVNI